MDERKPKMQKTLMLTDKGYKDLKKASSMHCYKLFNVYSVHDYASGNYGAYEAIHRRKCFMD